MKHSVVALAALVLAVQASPANYGAGAPAHTYSAAPAETSTTTTTPMTPQPGGPCTEGTNFCAGNSGETNIILRCTSGKLQPGNCNDNLGEPALGAVCIDSAAAPGGAAQCQAVTASSTAEAAPVSTGGSQGGSNGGAPSTPAPATTASPASSAAAPAGNAPPPAATVPSIPPATGNSTQTGVPIPPAEPASSASTKSVAFAAVVAAVAAFIFA